MEIGAEEERGYKCVRVRFDVYTATANVLSILLNSSVPFFILDCMKLAWEREGKGI